MFIENINKYDCTQFYVSCNQNEIDNALEQIIEKNPSILPLSVCHVFDCDARMMSLYTLHIDNVGNKVWIRNSAPLIEVR